MRWGEKRFGPEKRTDASSCLFRASSITQFFVDKMIEKKYAIFIKSIYIMNIVMQR
jgi:hypothetical protein